MEAETTKESATRSDRSPGSQTSPLSPAGSAARSASSPESPASSMSDTLDTTTRETASGAGDSLTGAGESSGDAEARAGAGESSGDAGARAGAGESSGDAGARAGAGAPAGSGSIAEAPKSATRPSRSDDSTRQTTSGIQLKLFYRPEDTSALDYESELGDPGEYPFTRGIYPNMYRGRLWTMRQYAGYGTAEETNARFRYLLEAGQTGLSVAFDLPTQMGLDSDSPRATGEVGKVGVAIDTIEDMRTLFAGIPLDKVTTSMTINAPASILLLMYQLVAEEQGADASDLGGTIQNDILKEYVARGTYIFPPRPSMRIITDTFAYCRRHLPKWNTISISGYHIREAGATAVQEVAFTLSNAIAYVEAALNAGLDVDEFAPRLSFFWNAHNNFFEEVAKFRAARRMWARIMRERFGAKDKRSWLMRFHTQTAGSMLTAQQPENNIVRTTLQGLAAVLGGTQSLHTNSFDEALGLPTQRAARIALRTQQIIAYESGVADVVDPLGGSWYVERLTDELEERAEDYIDRIQRMGGAVAAIEAGFMQREIERSAYEWAREVEERKRIIVGVNEFTEDEEEAVEILRVDEELEKRQIERLARWRERRAASEVDRALSDVRAAAAGTENLLEPMKEALRVGATLGEICDVLREVFGVYEPRF
jgi:methylmalonyl-CoA mutase N-terminal domain/subunit